ncbi:MAG: hypothetical protein AB8C02_00740 [Halioglobus sp.]
MLDQLYGRSRDQHDLALPAKLTVVLLPPLRFPLLCFMQRPGVKPWTNAVSTREPEFW